MTRKQKRKQKNTLHKAMVMMLMRFVKKLFLQSFFSKMTKQMLRGIRVENKEELKNRIYKYFDEINKEPVVFRWTCKMKDLKLPSSDDSSNT